MKRTLIRILAVLLALSMVAAPIQAHRFGTRRALLTVGGFTYYDVDVAANWTSYDPGGDGVGTDPDGYIGGVFDGRYLYAIPSYNGTDRHGEFLRYDTQATFDASGSWTSYDPGADGVGTDPDGYFGGVFDGRYLYAMPDHNGTDRHGEFLRYDTQATFDASGSWTSYDPGGDGVGTDPDGYFGGVFDGRYLYAIPSYNGTDHHGEFLRFKAKRPPEVPNTVYGGSLF